MPTLPVVSVVMSVHNGDKAVQDTIASVLEQDNCDFEFIIVDDGSTDTTASVLAQYAAKDKRVRIFSHANCGLTQSLIRGCSEARGNFIARQDCGDISLPGRLAKQGDFLARNPGAVAVSCGTSFLGPGRERLYDIVQNERDIEQALRSDSPRTLRGPSHHGSVMFRKESYVMAGGYRPQFYVAQDLDLWTRLVDFGEFRALSEVLYEAVLTPGSVSSTMRGAQVVMTEIIAACGKRRRNGKSEADLLAQALAVSARGEKTKTKDTDADFYYFIAGCLRNNDPGLARHYYKTALQANPFHYKSILRLMFSGIR